MVFCCFIINMEISAYISYSGSAIEAINQLFFQLYRFLVRCFQPSVFMEFIDLMRSDVKKIIFSLIEWR